MKQTKLLFCSIFALLLSFTSWAQPNDVEMATGMRADGMIYVVIAVLCTVFTGIVIYTVLIDKKVSKLEKELNDK